MEIVFATANPHKLEEVREICGDCGIDFILPNEGFNPIENGESFEENSLIKAQEAYRVSKKYVLADDSGLCVNALDGAPGLYSARYAGSQDEKIKRLLNELELANDRSAKFVCCMTLLNDEGEKIFETTGICKGKIIKERHGVNGFGYDPVFVPDGCSKTMAELSPDEKNQISHRANALKNILNFIKTIS